MLPLQPKTLLLILVLLILLVSTSAAAYFFYQTQPLKQKADSLPLDKGELEGVVTNPNQPNIDPAADWLTFHDSINNFSFKYPPTWSDNCSLDAFCVQSPDLKVAFDTDKEAGLQYVVSGGVFGVNIMTDPQTPSTNLNDFCLPGGPLQIESCEPVLFQNTNAVKRINSAPGHTENYFFIKNGLIYSLGFSSNSTDTEVSNTLSQILSTFHFTD